MLIVTKTFSLKSTENQLNQSIYLGVLVMVAVVVVVNHD